MMDILVWLSWATVATAVLVSVLPLIPTGYWWVRVWDFPRVQLGLVALIPFLVTLFVGFSSGFGTGEWVILGLSTAVTAWQFSHVLPFSRLWPREVPDASAGEPEIRLLEVNLKFDNDRYEDVAKMIRHHDPDILILLEINEEWNNALAEIRAGFSYSETVVEGEGLGIACWARFPVNSSEVRYIVEDRRASIWTVMELPATAFGRARKINVVSIHPTPPGLNDSTGEARRNSRPRDTELVVVAREVQKQPDAAWMVVGDFNDVAWSHTTRLFKRLSGLLDPRVGRSLVNSFHADYPPFRCPIDHIFVSHGFVLHHFDRVRTPGSDHFAILSKLSLPVGGQHDSSDANTSDFEEADKIVEEGAEEADDRDIKASEADRHRAEKSPE